MNLFKSKTPSIADVDAELSRLDQQRADMRRRRAEIETALADAYGDDSAPQDGLQAEYSAIESRMGALSIVQTRLEAERKAAVKRELIGQLNADVDAALKTYDKLPSLQAKREKAQAAYFAAIDAENEARRELQIFMRDFALDRARRAGEELAAHGMSLADVAEDFDQARARLGDLNDKNIGLVGIDGKLQFLRV